MNRPGRFLVLCIAAAAAAALPIALSGCGSYQAKAPQVTVGVVTGPKSGDATITVAAAGGRSTLDMGLFVRDPAGHRSSRGYGLLEDGTRLGYGLRALRPGTYRYFVFAVPTSSQNVYALPASDLVQGNLVTAGSFTVQ